MKKTITLMALLFSLVANSQTANITIQNVDPENNICPGDSVKISFTFNVAPSATFNVKAYFYNEASAYSARIIFNGQISDLRSGENGYFVMYRIPQNETTGQTRICKNSNDQNCYYINIAQCVTTGINEFLQSKPSQETKYFNLNGIEIEKVYNQLIIEQKGVYHRKVVISE